MIVVTQWFSPNVTPVHVGDYEREYTNGIGRFLDRWDGSKWILLDDRGNSVGRAMVLRRWRGLVSTKEPG